MMGFIWIYGSDYLATQVSWIREFDDRIQTFKGLFYVLATAILLYYMVKKLVNRHERELLHRLEYEKALEQSTLENERFRNLFEQASSGMVITDSKQPDNPIIYVNEGFERLTGFTKDEVIGLNARFLQGKKSSEITKEKIRKAIAEDKPIQVEIENYHKNGDLFWNELKITPIYDESKNLQYYIGIQNDITEKKTQQILLENQFNIVQTLLATNKPTQAFSEICKIIEEHMDYQCMITRVDEEKEFLNHFASASLPAAFIDTIVQIPIKDQEGIIGTAAYRKKTVILDNFSKSDYFENQFIDRSLYDFQASWTTPLLTLNGDILGTFTMFAKSPHYPTKTELQAFQTYSYIIGMALQNVGYQEQLMESERLYRVIAENTTDIVCLLDENLEVDYISPSYGDLFSGKPSMKEIASLMDPDSLKCIYHFVKNLQKDKEVEMIEVKAMDENKNWHWYEVQGSQFLDQDKSYSLLAGRDITARKNYEDALDRVLYYDSLTQLPNRYRLKQELEELLKNKQPFSFFILDFDQMKEIKRIYGQEASDRILLQFDKITLDYFDDVFISRTGEDEFSVIVKNNMSREEIKLNIERFLNYLKQPWEFETFEIVATVSIGIVLSEAQTADMVLVQAETAMQAARDKGKHRYAFYLDSLTEGEKSSIAIQSQLYQAVDKDEFTVYYQPQVNLNTKEVEGLEALIRWNNQELGFISPGEFIPIAEESGWISTISNWMMEEVFKDIVGWEAEGINLHVAINISYRQIEESDFVENVMYLLNKTGCLADNITFEITESILMEDLDLALKVLTEIKALGIRISIDDFGIGYSSLSYLKKFPIDSLKIDRAFVKNIQEDKNDMAIVQAIMEMSKSLEMTVIAEGVETVQQIHILKELGCTAFQGFWFSRPVPKSELAINITHIYDEKLELIS